MREQDWKESLGSERRSHFAKHDLGMVACLDAYHVDCSEVLL